MREKIKIMEGGRYLTAKYTLWFLNDGDDDYQEITVKEISICGKYAWITTNPWGCIAGKTWRNIKSLNVVAELKEVQK